MLKGGCSASEFYSTFLSFHVNNVSVVTEANLRSQDLLEDHPINLRDPKLLEKPELLPQMRFLHSDLDLLELTFELLLWSGRVGFQGASERSKIESLLNLIATHFFKLDYNKISYRSKKLRIITDEEI